MSVADIAKQVDLSSVKRQMTGFQAGGDSRVYSGYRQEQVDGAVEAFIELRFSGTADFEAIVGTAADIVEVQEIFTTAGDPDALIRIRTSDVEHLKHVVNGLRRSRHITGTKTLMVLDSWHRNIG